MDDIEVAQFIYFILTNKKIRRVIDTLTSKAVLILGRFTKKRKAILDALREKLSNMDYLPIIFDFDKPTDRDLTETVKAALNALESLPDDAEKAVLATDRYLGLGEGFDDGRLDTLFLTLPISWRGNSKSICRSIAQNPRKQKRGGGLRLCGFEGAGFGENVRSAN